MKADSQDQLADHPPNSLKTLAPHWYDLNWVKIASQSEDCPSCCDVGYQADKKAFMDLSCQEVLIMALERVDTLSSDKNILRYAFLLSCLMACTPGQVEIHHPSLELEDDKCSPIKLGPLWVIISAFQVRKGLRGPLQPLTLRGAKLAAWVDFPDNHGCCQFVPYQH
ncbi:hypothetical protein DSO57_1016803 [Entomophthora muscae]|uniref:Uncharacterized protein n=1 Tax=Entomophthora muscae TaxID=34485 RepID=A0ACC2STP0_9FUNG|nr:hypothetical protein DSO57_1016803 [Entomophthora muscae]